jgi:hypothetical protein
VMIKKLITIYLKKKMTGLRVNRLDQDLGLVDLPELLLINDQIIESIDYLIICAGFEDRAVRYLKELIERKIRLTVIIVNYSPFIVENKSDEVTELCELSGLEYVQVEYDRQQPTGAGDRIIEFVKNENSKLHIDISGMSRLLVIQLLEAVSRKRNSFVNVFIIYSEAEYYHPDENDFKSRNHEGENEAGDLVVFITSGVFEILVLPELASTSLHNQPIRLIAFPSFNSYQMLSLRVEIQPSYMTVIHGIPPNDKNSWRRDAIKELNHIDGIQNIEQCDVSTFDYKDTYKILLEQYDKYSDMEKLFISPTGSKMQSVVIGILRSYLSDIQVVYPLPMSFTEPQDYTKGVKETYFLDLSVFPKMNSDRN